MFPSATPHRAAPKRWAARAALGVAASAVFVTAAPNIGAAAPTPPPPAPAAGWVEQAAQLLQTINRAATEATADPTITLATCLFDEARSQIDRFVAGTFQLDSAINGFTSCIVAFGAGGDPGTVVPGPGTGEDISQLPPGQVTNAAYVAPAAGTLTSTFGERWGAIHYGIDIANRIGTPIVSVAAGTVINSGPAQGFGRWVRVQHDDGTITVYGHNSANLVVVGQRVRTNQIIAKIGNEGESTGPHVHFEVIRPYSNNVRVDPLPWLRARGVSV